MKKQWSFFLAMLIVMAIMVMGGCGGGGGGSSSGSTDTGGGSNVTAFTAAMVSGKTIAMSIQGVSGSATFVLNADGTWTGTNVFNEALLGTWSVNSSGKLVVLNKASFTGETYDTMTITITSGSLPTLSVTGVTVYTDGSPNDSDSGTLVISTTASSTSTYSISGTITSGGTALVGVTVTLAGSGSTTATTDSSGNYSFSGAQNGNYTLTPTKTGYTFTPASPSVTVNGANATGKNFTATQATLTGTIQLPKTGQTVSYVIGDDANLHKGATWPSPRFTNNGNGTVTDNMTGLIWLRSTECFYIGTSSVALTSANTLASGACGLSDNSVAGQ